MPYLLLFDSNCKEVINLLLQDEMGSCAGCNGPQRRLRDNHSFKKNNNTSLNKTKPNQNDTGDLANTNSLEKEVNRTLGIEQSFDALFSDEKKPWRSRIVAKAITQYIKPATLEQSDTQDNYDRSLSTKNIFENYAPAHRTGTLKTQSLDESIIARKILSPKSYRKKYAHEQLFDSDNENQEAHASTKHGRHNISITTEYEPQEYPTQEMTLSRALPIKAWKHKQNQLEDILEIMGKQAETPFYVRQIKKQIGEDISCNNFGSMQPVGEFAPFSVKQYLEDIEA